MERGLGWQGNRFVPIRRTHILFDGFDQLGKLHEGLRGRVRVQMINQHGEAEAGGWPAGAPASGRSAGRSAARPPCPCARARPRTHALSPRAPPC